MIRPFLGIKNMRFAPLSLLISLSLFSFSTVAQDTNTVTAIENNITLKQADFDSFTELLNKHLKEESQQQHQLDLLRARSTKLEKEKNQALDAMNALYRRLIEDPSLDISDTKTRYQNAVNSHKTNKEEIAMQLASIAAHRKDIEKIRIDRHSLLNTLEGLKEQKNTARVERLRNEFNRDGTLEIQNTINCKRTETLAACEQRGQHLGMQKATNRFLDQVFANLTEIRLVEPKRNSAGARVQVLNSHVVNSGFSGHGNYDVNLSVTMRGEANNSRLCHLLNLDNRFCSEYSSSFQSIYSPQDTTSFTGNVRFTDPVTAPDSFAETEKKSQSYSKPVVDVLKEPEISYTHELTLRSNVHDDEVFIDGVSKSAFS